MRGHWFVNGVGEGAIAGDPHCPVDTEDIAKIDHGPEARIAPVATDDHGLDIPFAKRHVLIEQCLGIAAPAAGAIHTLAGIRAPCPAPQPASPDSSRRSIVTLEDRLKPTASTSISASAASGVRPVASKRTKRTGENFCSGSFFTSSSNSTTRMVLLLIVWPTRSKTIRLPPPKLTGTPGLVKTEKK